MKRLMFGLFAAVVMSSLEASIPRVIFDTDMYTDYDDVGALAILHAMADAGECELIAVGCNTWGEGNRSVAACEVVNAYYGRAELPVGCARSGGVRGKGNAGFGLSDAYPEWVSHLVSTSAPTAVEVYLEALKASPDKSVVLCSVGFLNNVADLLKADSALVARKVRLWVAMACSYPKGKEYNSQHDPAASDYAFSNFPKDVPIVWTDFQYGRTCFSGRAVAELPDSRNPVRDVFAKMLLPREKVVEGKTWDQMTGHPSWDETAALIAVRGWEPYFNLEHGVFRMVGSAGDDEWMADSASLCGRVTEKLSRAEVAKVIDELMCRPPRRLRAEAPRVHFVAEHPWKAYYSTNTLEQIAPLVKGYADGVTLPSGETLTAKSFSLDGESRACLDPLLGVEHRENHWEPDAKDCHYALLVNELYAPEAGTAMIGASAEWWMSLYVNGEKVYTTWPDGDGYGSVQYTNHVIPVPLKKGRNLVVMHTHRGLGRWYVAFGEAPKMPSRLSRQEVERFFFPEQEQVDCGPWLTDPAADSVTVSFVLPRTRRAGIEYRKAGSTAEWTKLWQQAGIQKKTDAFFRYEIGGLEPDTTYEYRVVTIVGQRTKRSPEYHFRTWSAKPQTVRLTVTADSHLDSPDAPADRFVPISEMPKAREADVFVSLGDSTSRGENIRMGMLDYYMKGVLNVFGHDRYVFTVHGNHEWRGEDASRYFTYFPKGYYSCRMGEAFLLVLDSGERDPIDTWQGKADPDAAYNVFDAAYMAEQRAWLEETLKSEACRTAKFRIVMIHCPPTSLLPYEKKHVRPLVEGLLCSWDKAKKPEVQTHLWLTGHKHESWFRERLGINELQICGPNHAGGGLGCATVEVGPDALRVTDWHVRWKQMAYDLSIAPDGTVTRIFDKDRK